MNCIGDNNMKNNNMPCVTHRSFRLGGFLLSATVRFDVFNLR
jgi:hypothetical protein